eukprot:7687044-Alexandrium_andersonii.AAC.1
MEPSSHRFVLRSLGRAPASGFLGSTRMIRPRRPTSTTSAGSSPWLRRSPLQWALPGGEVAAPVWASWSRPSARAAPTPK